MLNENLQQALNDFAKDIVKFAQINLGDRNRKRKSKLTGKVRRGAIDSSGALRKSFDSDVKINENSAEMTIEALSYAEDVDTGAKRKASGSSLLNWVKNKPIRFRDENGKLIKSTQARKENFAEFAKWKVETIGSDETRYLRDAIEDATKKHEDELIDSMFKDIESATEFILRNLETKE